ncbi:DUF2000 family protein [Rathayibacter sp. VKM Ac-2803]|uniref:DUF2000 domain-containing protein n=1 Tax=Rathayibacter sp. VKM Ac-2803 TaxID=2609256 RepID=UPI001359B0CA|nr:DUF2000 domain-containing protein [Rathayibacter sp. VKM Ac-2803]MWV48679.1 DUF2000 family protein [Rathayibacter sp. VKM Ac-2803]
MTEHAATPVGFAPDEIDTSAPTRAARLKWVVVVDEALPPGRAVNAAICVSAATTAGVAGLLGPSATDASGSTHPGIPWVGCTVLAADAATLRAIRAKAIAHEGTFVADMPAEAQAIRVYDDYRAVVATTEEFDYLAVSVVGPKNRIAKLVDRLPLLP